MNASILMHVYILLLERSPFHFNTIFISLPCEILKFVCLSFWIFIWGINHIKIDQFSRNLDMLLQLVALVITPKIVIFFTGTHKNFEYFFHAYSVVDMFMGQCHKKKGFNYRFLTTTWSSEIGYRDTREGFWEVL